MVLDVPQTRFAIGRDGAHIAYQVIGQGPRDLVYVPNWASPIDLMWDHPAFARFLQRLASFSRLIIFDKRGSGSSDHVPFDALATLEDWTDDVVAVMDTVGSERVALIGAMVGAPIAILFAATYPDRVSKLVLANASARALADNDYPGLSPEQIPQRLEHFKSGWGTEAVVELLAPTMGNDTEFRRWFAGFCRMGNPPTMATAVYRAQLLTDIRPILPVISAPTLVLQRDAVRGGLTTVLQAQYLAQHIAEARYVEIPGEDFLVCAGDTADMLDEIEAFVTGERPQAQAERVLATVLFTDIASSTELAAKLGDRSWREILERFRGVVRDQLNHFGGQEVNTRGDDFLATFDGPARAVRCAMRLTDAFGGPGLQVRAGVHTGEVELLGGDVGGMTVHIGARVSELAEPGETLVSRTVTDLVVGSGIQFQDRGDHELKGVPGVWKLFAARS
jgi:class 3 adenylate cyclase